MVSERVQYWRTVAGQPDCFSPIRLTFGKADVHDLDLCYNIRHFELHGRELADPWSCQQSAVHQKYYFANGESNWIYVQPPKLFLTALRDFEIN